MSKPSSISILAFREEGDFDPSHGLIDLYKISILAFREEGDVTFCQLMAPWWEISILAFREEGDQTSKLLEAVQKDFNPRLP